MCVQAYMVVELHQKMDVLWSFIKSHLKAKTIVFLSTCKQARPRVHTCVHACVHAGIQRTAPMHCHPLYLGLVRGRRGPHVWLT